MRRAPLLAALLPLMAGIALGGSVCSLQPAVGLWAMVVTGAIAAIVVVASERGQGRVKVVLRSSFNIFLTLMFASVGLLLATLDQPHLRPDHYSHHCQPEATLLLCLSETPHTTARSLRAVAQVEGVATDTGLTDTRGRMLLYFKPDTLSRALRCGDRIVARVRPQLPPSADSLSRYNRRLYLLRHGVTHQTYVASGACRRVGERRLTLRSRAEDLRAQFLLKLRDGGLSPSHSAVAEALILGWRDDLDPQTTVLYRNAGIAHLLCVSGLHVGLVAAALTWLLWFIGRRRWQRALRGVLVVAGVWAFALLSGLAPSTVRASLMCTAFILTDILGLRTSAYNTLSFAALCMLIAKPLLLFDIGFQLSFAAVAGIVAGTSALKQVTTIRNALLYRVVQLFVVTTSAQLATLPFTLYHFHQFPTYFLVANMTVVPLASVLLVAALAVLVAGDWMVVGSLCQWVLQTLLTAVDTLLSVVGSWPHAVLTVDNFPLWAAATLAMAVVALLVVANMTGRRRLAT